MSSRKGGTASTSSRRLPPLGDHSAEELAAAWLFQARRLLNSADLPIDLVTIRSTQDEPLATIKLPPETANAVVEWALEAATRVLRDDPQPSDAEVYKAARAMLS